MKACLFVSLVICCGPALAQSGGPWAITSSTIDGGGATSTGGSWAATGTIGQPDASVQQSTGARWTFAGGFWPVMVAAPVGPGLTIIRLGLTFAQISWTAESIGYKVQFSSDLITWTDYPGGTVTGTTYITWPLQNGPRWFFRLKKL